MTYLDTSHVAAVGIGMVIGAAFITWGLADTSELPPQNAVEQFAEEKYREAVVDQRQYIDGVETVSFTESRYPSFYKAVYNVSTDYGYAEKEVYISKDGLMMSTPEKIRFPRDYRLESFGQEVAAYVED